jgi:dTDP-4-dehydrorhamnose 3,5-epimerase
MKFTETAIKGVYYIDLKTNEDERGWFARAFCINEFAQIEHTKNWLQINHSFTKYKGTIRGMHYQNPPFNEIKLVRCISGAILDVVVDIRKGSPTFLKWISVELSMENKRMIYIPEGMAHGFQTLTDDVELLYHHSAIYEPSSEAGLHYNDPALQISWNETPTVVSEKDKTRAIINESFNGI